MRAIAGMARSYREPHLRGDSAHDASYEKQRRV